MKQMTFDEAEWLRLQHKSAIAPKGTKTSRLKALQEYTKKMLMQECGK